MQMSNPDKPDTALPARGRSPYLLWAIWVIWLPFFASSVVEIFQSHSTTLHLAVSLVAAALFFSIYLWATLRNAQRLVASSSPATLTPALVWLPIAILMVLSFLLTWSNGPAWGTLFIFTAAYTAGRLPTVQATLTLIMIELTIIIATWLFHLNWGDVLPGIGDIAIIGVVVMSLVRSVATDRELRAAREEIARLAVMTERLRIARDLHDLLGHNLSLIALKSELAGRLLSRAPERAAIEIGDVEHVARTTLEEVRLAVANYRQPTLANELHAASEILAAAGIIYNYQDNESNAGALPTPLETVLSWTVREGVTNVIRHSHAQQCTIHVTRDKQSAGVEVIDDGQRPVVQTFVTDAAGNTVSNGNGLRGLKERVGALGGQCEIGPCATGGFRLAVSVPIVYKNQPGDTGSITL
jgi:two-component system, NarL family, sensor histidine kinase DesK